MTTSTSIHNVESVEFTYRRDFGYFKSMEIRVIDEKGHETNLILIADSRDQLDLGTGINKCLPEWEDTRDVVIDEL